MIKEKSHAASECSNLTASRTAAAETSYSLLTRSTELSDFTASAKTTVGTPTAQNEKLGSHRDRQMALASPGAGQIDWASQSSWVAHGIPAVPVPCSPQRVPVGLSLSKG